MIWFLKKIKKIIFSIIAIIVIAFVGYAGFTLWLNRTNNEATEITSDFISNEVTAISEYVTLNYQYTNVGKFENTLDFYGLTLPLTTKSFIISYDGNMKFGIETDKSTVTMTDDLVTIVLPPVKIISHEINEDSIKVFDETQNIFNPIQVGDYTEFASEQKKVMETRATDNGMYKEAAENAVNQIKGMIEKLPEVQNSDYKVAVESTESNE